jgi:dolichyl-phosphate-mannose--protein O-mannosyl transferase
MNITKKYLRKKLFLWLTALFCLALCLRAARCFLINRIDKDSVSYIKMAEDFWRRDFRYAFEDHPRMPPLYILGMAAGEKAGIGAYSSGLIISVLAGALLPLAVFIAAMALFKNIKYSLAATALAAVHPYLVRISADIMRDSLFVSFSAFSLAFALSAVKDGKISVKWAVAGLFAGCSVMSRSEGIEIFFALAIWFAAELFFRPNSIKTFISWSVPSLLVFSFFFASVSFPVEFMLRGTSSEWHVIDRRLVGYMNDFLTSARLKPGPPEKSGREKR